MTRDAKKFLIWVGCGILVLICLSSIGSLFGLGNSAVGEWQTYEVTGEVKTLEVEIEAADFRIENSDSFSVRSNLKNLTFRQTGDKLVLTEKSFGTSNHNGAELVIYIPASAVFDRIDITTGAGRFTAGSLTAQRLDFEFGAGEINIGELNATGAANITSGAGEVTIGGGGLNNLKLEMGAGELNLVSKMTGNDDLDLGVGEVNITLIGSRADYTVELNKGIGSIIFEGENISTGKTVGDGQNKVKINGGVGAIEVKFK